jgi:hypothetical protein
MLSWQAGTEAHLGERGYRYERHRPEPTRLYQPVRAVLPRFRGPAVRPQGTELPEYVRREFEDYLKCGRLEHGFLRVRCDTCHAEHLVAFRCKRRGACPNRNVP